MIQGAVNLLNANLVGQQATNALGSAPIDFSSESSFKDILISKSGSQWPRVALTITALQSNAYKSAILTGNSGFPGDSCMRLSAVVWSDMKTSKNIPEETFCLGQMHGHSSINSTGEILSWGMFEDLGRKTQNTGHVRTNGPIPPAKLFPEGADYKGFFNSSRVSVIFGALVRVMGYDLSLDGEKDRRLWIVSIPSEGEIYSNQKILR